MIGHKSSLNKFTRFEIIESTFSDQKHIKLEINKDKISRKRTAVWKIKHFSTVSTKVTLNSDISIGVFFLNS